MDGIEGTPGILIEGNEGSGMLIEDGKTWKDL